MDDHFALKDRLVNREKVVYLADLLRAGIPDFASDDFVAAVMDGFLELELKNRIRRIAAVLEQYLLADYEAAAAGILRALPPPLDPTKTDGDFGDFIFAPLGVYVATVGVRGKYFEVSMSLLRELTMRFSMEDSIRAFLRAFPAETLAILAEWASDENYHVRRLVSEGTRPLLPWSERIPQTPHDTLPLLQVLYGDSTRYVTRSVANHLNDIAKRDPDIVIAALRLWQEEGRQDKKELAWITKHALRTLIKRGYGEAFQLLGYCGGVCAVDQFLVSPIAVSPGEVVTLSVEVVATADTSLLIDYVIHFVKKRGTANKKVYKWKTVSLKKGESLTLQKSHRLKADATTFSLYAGLHRVELQVNGRVLAQAQFTLHLN